MIHNLLKSQKCRDPSRRETPLIMGQLVQDVREYRPSVDLNKALLNHAGYWILVERAKVRHGPVHTDRAPDRNMQIPDPSARDVGGMILKGRLAGGGGAVAGMEDNGET